MSKNQSPLVCGSRLLEWESVIVMLATFGFFRWKIFNLIDYFQVFGSDETAAV